MHSKTILITGCSSGIGLCAAETLHKQGWQVFATVRQAVDEKRLHAQGIQTVRMELRDPASIAAGVEAVLAQTDGQLGALCNNAGFGQAGAIEDVSLAGLRQQFETNVFGLQQLTNLVVPVMRRQGYGRIIQISSILGLVTMGYRGAYCASKYAVEALTDALRLELYDSNIWVSLIEPGPIESQFRQTARAVYTQHVQVDQSHHKADYANLIHNMERLKSDSKLTLPPDAVVKKIQHALASKRPKIRYYVTLPAYVFALLKRILPSGWMDWVMRQIMLRETRP
jgi:short-subunit dehydrogenase